MLVASCRLKRVAGPSPGAGNARTAWAERQGVLLELEDEEGRRGRGEASPLPGFSVDSLAMAEADLHAWAEHLPRRLEDVPAIFAAAAEAASPAARFALESALLDLLGQERELPIYRLLGGRDHPIPLVHLLPVNDTLAAAEELYEAGARHFKVKVGGDDFAAELAMLTALRGRFGQKIELRLDANRGLAGPGREEKIAALAAFDPELLEEPGGDFEIEAPYPLAFDESLLEPPVRAALPGLLRKSGYRVVVLKPMALGGFAACLELARVAAAAGCASVVTHLFDGPIALAAAAHLALALPGRVLPCGLASHTGLDAWSEAAPDFVRKTQILAPASPGLGLRSLVEATPWDRRAPARLLPSAPGAELELGGLRGLPLVHFSVFAAADEAGDRTALVVGGATTPFASLADQVKTLLAAWQPDPDTALVLVGDNHPETIVAILAAIEAEIPLFLIHPRWPELERSRYLSSLGLPPLPPGTNSIFVPWPADAPPAGTGNERILAVLPTSGTGGRPKGVALSRRAFLAATLASAAILGWKGDDRWLLSLPLAHVGGLSILLRCLAARRAVVLADPAERFEPAAVAAQLIRDRVTLLSLVPTLLRRLLELEGFALPPHLRAILVGGAAASPRLLEKAARRGWPCLATYGSTEACSQIATQEAPRPRGCGRPVRGVEIRLGPDGLIAVRGENLLSFYLPGGHDGRDENGFFKTGDLGRRDEEDQLHVLGRGDDVIVSGGENVHPLQVEAALEEHPALAAAGVFPLADDEWGQIVAAAVVVAPGETLPSLEELRDGLRAVLPAYALPRRLFVAESLPQNAAGKLDRRTLAAAFR
jgi:O-succinylbenzoic acid--CoA ligase